MTTRAVTLSLALLLAGLAAAPGADDAPSPALAAASRSLDDVTLELDPGTGIARIPIDLRGNHIYMRGRINDSDSLWMVLDSGASGNVVDSTVAGSIGLVSTRTVHGQGAGGKVEAGWVEDATVRLPGATLTGVPTTIMALDAFRRQTGRSMEVILGHPLISRCVVRIDYAARQLELLPAEGFEYRGQGTVLPITYKQRLPYITARVTLPGRKSIEGRFVVDLGSTRAIIFTPGFIAKERALEAIPKTLESRGRGVGGQVQSRAGRVARIELGGFAFEQPIASFPVSEKTRISAPGTAGNIGGEIMRRFTVTLDYPRDRIILEPNANFSQPFEDDMSGLAPRMGPEGSNALEVEWIQPASPAAEAGVLPNDLIERVNDRPALEVGVPGLREMFRRVGETHRLTIRRGEERREITLTTRRLI